MSASDGSHNYGMEETQPTADTQQPPELDRERLFEVLSNRRRRFAMHYLKRHPNERVDMGDLSTQVAAWEHGVGPDRLGYDQRKTVHTALYQHHAPKLADAGVVEYNASRGEIELTDAGASVDLYLEAVDSREMTWATYFVLLASVVGLSVVGGTAGVGPLDVVPDAAWGVVAAGTFLVSSLVFAYSTRTDMRIGVDGPPPEADTDETRSEPP